MPKYIYTIVPKWFAIIIKTTCQTITDICTPPLSWNGSLSQVLTFLEPGFVRPEDKFTNVDERIRRRNAFLHPGQLVIWWVHLRCRRCSLFLFWGLRVGHSAGRERANSYFFPPWSTSKPELYSSLIRALEGQFFPKAFHTSKQCWVAVSHVNPC